MQLNIRQTSSLWQNINFVNKLEDISNYTLKKVLKKHNFLHLEIDLNLTDDKQIAALNKASRGVDKPTNVLSFQYIDWQQKQFLSHEYLGEIAISFQTVEIVSISNRPRFSNSKEKKRPPLQFQD